MTASHTGIPNWRMFGWIAAAWLLAVAAWWVWHGWVYPRFVCSPGYSFNVPMPGSRTLVWRQHKHLGRGVLTTVRLRDARHAGPELEDAFANNGWLTNAEFHVAPDGQSVYVITQDTTNTRSGANAGPEQRLVAHLALSNGRERPEIIQRGYGGPPDQQEAAIVRKAKQSPIVARWMLLYVGEPAVLLHWSRTHGATTVRYRDAAPDEHATVIVETGNECYATARAPLSPYLGILLQGSGARMKICGWVDGEGRSFFDDKRYVWSYSLGPSAAIVRSPTPASSYPQDAQEQLEYFSQPSLGDALDGAALRLHRP